VSQRYAKVFRSFRSMYPELPAGDWLLAWEAAMRVAQRVWRESGAEAVVYGRLLPEEHFEFAGGDPRPADWEFHPERLSDPTPTEILPG